MRPNGKVMASASVAIGIAVGLGACKFPSKKSKANHEGADALIVNREIRFLRKEPEKTAGTMTFATVKPLLCAVEYWPQGKTPAGDEKTPEVPCPEGGPATDFAVPFADLDPKAMYSFRLRLWDAKDGKDRAQIIRVDENSIDGTRINGTEMLVAVVNIPQKIAEIHSYPLAGSRTLDEVQKPFVRALGCGDADVTWQNPYTEATATLPLGELASDGFAAGQAVAHADYANRALLAFDALQPSQRWQLTFNWRGKPVELAMPAPAQLATVVVTNGEEHQVNNRDMNQAPLAFPLYQDKKAVLTWKARNAPATSYVVAQLRGKATGRLLTCVYPANDNQGEIAAANLKSLPKDEYQLTVYLEAALVNAQTPAGSPAWLVSSQDWRLSRVSIQ